MGRTLPWKSPAGRQNRYTPGGSRRSAALGFFFFNTRLSSNHSPPMRRPGGRSSSSRSRQPRQMRRRLAPPNSCPAAHTSKSRITSTVKECDSTFGGSISGCQIDGAIKLVGRQHAGEGAGKMGRKLITVNS